MDYNFYLDRDIDFIFLRSGKDFNAYYDIYSI